MLYVWLNFFFQANGIPGFDGLNFFFLVILSELTVQCIIATYTDGSLHIICALWRSLYKVQFYLHQESSVSKSRMAPAILTCQNAHYNGIHFWNQLQLLFLNFFFLWYPQFSWEQIKTGSDCYAWSSLMPRALLYTFTNINENLDGLIGY